MTTLKKTAQDDLKAYLERVERLELERKELSDDIKAVYAEAKSAGFDTRALRKLVQLRKKAAAEREEEQAILDTYMHAVGMASEAPLFAAVGAMGVDLAQRDQVIEAFKLLVPPMGEVIVKVGGNPIRLWRDDAGTAHAADYVEPDIPSPPEKTGRALKKSATVLSVVPKERGPSAEEIKRIADAAEERSKGAKRDGDAAPAEGAPEHEPAPA